MYEEDKFPGSRATDIPRVQMQIDDKLEEIRNANGKPTFFFSFILPLCQLCFWILPLKMQRYNVELPLKKWWFSIEKWPIILHFGGVARNGKLETESAEVNFALKMMILLNDSFKNDDSFALKHGGCLIQTDKFCLKRPPGSGPRAWRRRRLRGSFTTRTLTGSFWASSWWVKMMNFVFKTRILHYKWWSLQINTVALAEEHHDRDQCIPMQLAEFASYACQDCEPSLQCGFWCCFCAVFVVVYGCFCIGLWLFLC